MGGYVLRSYYEDVFFEFQVHPDERDAFIILPGFPSSSSGQEVISFLYEKGFNVFAPKYRGTFQSRGKFLQTSPVEDLERFMFELKKGEATNLWDMKKVFFKIKRIFVIGSSFGGSIACALACSSKQISKVILASPVWDYKEHGRSFDEQNLEHLTLFIKRAFENLYRYDFKSLSAEMEKFKEFSFSYYKKNLKIPSLVFHDHSDRTVSIEHSRNAVKNIPHLQLIETNTGHGLSTKLLSQYYPEIGAFLGN